MAAPAGLTALVPGARLDLTLVLPEITICATVQLFTAAPIRRGNLVSGSSSFAARRVVLVQWIASPGRLEMRRRPLPCKLKEIRIFEHAGKMVRDAPKEKNMKRNISLWLGLLAFALLPAFAQTPGRSHG